MAKFIMANRRAGKFRETEKRASRASLDAFSTSIAASVNVISDFDPADDKLRRIMVFEADPKEIEEKRQSLSSDVMIEPEILHFQSNSRQALQFVSPFAANASPLASGMGASLAVTLKSGGAPVIASLKLILRGSGGQSREQSAQTNANGQAIFTFNPVWTPTSLIVIPVGGLWSMIVRGPRHTVELDLPPLPKNGPLDWWHRALGINSSDHQRGTGIRVGVIDTGVGPHGFLSHVKSVGAFINNVFDPSGGADADAHGSHVCGTIGARPTDGLSYEGIAPGVDLFCARVFPPDTGANQADIVLAIEHLSKFEQVDLINMSFGAPTASNIEQDAIQDALERGTLCICAAANSGGPVEFPAAFPECVAVSALGLEGWGPNGSLSSIRQPLEREKFGADNLFLANFSCFGAQIACAAPGVGIIATVPERHGFQTPYAAMDGTSMASPAACAALATILAATPAYLQLPRDVSRAEKARSLLKSNCRDLDMQAIFQGRGIPQAR